MKTKRLLGSVIAFLGCSFFCVHAYQPYDMSQLYNPMLQYMPYSAYIPYYGYGYYGQNIYYVPYYYTYPYTYGYAPTAMPLPWQLQPWYHPLSPSMQSPILNSPKNPEPPAPTAEPLKHHSNQGLPLSSLMDQQPVVRSHVIAQQADAEIMQPLLQDVPKSAAITYPQGLKKSVPNINDPQAPKVPDKAIKDIETLDKISKASASQTLLPPEKAKRKLREEIDALRNDCITVKAKKLNEYYKIIYSQERRDLEKALLDDHNQRNIAEEITLLERHENLKFHADFTRKAFDDMANQYTFSGALRGGVIKTSVFAGLQMGMNLVGGGVRLGFGLLESVFKAKNAAQSADALERKISTVENPILMKNFIEHFYNHLHNPALEPIFKDAKEALSDVIKCIEDVVVKKIRIYDIENEELRNSFFKPLYLFKKITSKDYSLEKYLDDRRETYKEMLDMKRDRWITQVMTVTRNCEIKYEFNNSLFFKSMKFIKDFVRLRAPKPLNATYSSVKRNFEEKRDKKISIKSYP